MITASLGKLCVAQSLTAGSDISDNVIQLAAVDYAAITDAWLVIDTNVVAGGSGSLKFALVLATAAGLGTSVEVVSTLLSAITDIRSATAGRHIININIGKMLKEMLDTSGSDYPFIGLKTTLGGSATISIDAVLSPTEPQSETHRQVTTSNVGIPGIGSAGSGF